jgi:phage tail sheath protein FI
VAGTLAALALARGAWLAPANRPLADVLALSPAVSRASWGRLTAAHVNALLRRSGDFVALSADTLSPEDECRPIQVRRLLILLKKLALREGRRFVFEPHSPDLRDRVRHRFERVLTDLYRRGAFAGATPDAAFRVRADEAINPPGSVERGRFIVELAVAPAPELAYLTVRLVAGPDQLTVEEV